MNPELAERTQEMVPRYERLFQERGGITPTDPLRFHFYHLSRYWPRLIGCCKRMGEPEKAVNSDYGACVAVVSDFVSRLIDPSSPIYEQWQECWRQTQAVLNERPVTLQDVEAASRAFEKCLVELRYDPWS